MQYRNAKQITMDQETLKGNRLIAEFMGYIYFEPDVDIDYSDIGGMYEKFNIYSKVPIEVNDYGSQKYFKELPNPDYGNKNPIRWSSDLKTLGWDTINSGNYLTELNYHQSWDWLMLVIEKIEDINEGLPESKNNFHFFIGKRYTRVIYNWDVYSTMHEPPKFASNQHALDWLKSITNCSKDYRHVIFDDNKLKSTWQAVVDFIEWWNLKQNK